MKKTTHLNNEALEGLRYSKSDNVFDDNPPRVGKKPSYAMYRGLIDGGYLNADGTLSDLGHAELVAADAKAGA
jgi:hypothetical protein